jgi:hypothetical protein
LEKYSRLFRLHALQTDEFYPCKWTKDEATLTV